MSTPRLAILASIVGLAAIAAYLTRGDREAAEASDRSDAPARKPAAGVARRGLVDSPLEIRERQRAEDEAEREAAARSALAPEAGTRAEARERLAEPVEPVEPVPAPPSSPTFAAATAAARVAAEDAVAELRGEMRRKCWDGLDRGGVGDEGVTLGFSLSFDPEGRVIASSVQQGRAAWIEGLDRCLAPFAHAVEVPAPGESVSVDVTFELP